MNRRFKPGDRVIIRAGAQIGFGFLGLSSEMAAIRDARSVGIVLNYSNGIQDYTVQFEGDPCPWRGVNDNEIEMAQS